MLRSGRWTEQFKYVPLNADGSVYLVAGLEARARYESVLQFFGQISAPLTDETSLRMTAGRMLARSTFERERL